jgi:hypothetical protein
VEGVARLGGDARVRAGGGEREARVLGIVVVVDQVVEGARVLGVEAEDLLEDGRRLLLDLAADERVLVQVVSARAEERGRAYRRAHEGEGMEGKHFRVVGMGRGEASHGLGVRAVARRLVPAPEQDLDRREEAPLAVGPRLPGPRLGRRAKPLQDLAGLLRVLVEPERLVVGHGLAPVGQGEAGIDSLRFQEGLDGVLVLEVVERGHAAQERGLRGGRAGVGKADGRQEGEHGEREGAHGLAMLARERRRPPGGHFFS